MTPDELRFKRVLMDAVEQCRKIRYNPTRFVQMIEQQGPFDAVRALLDAPSISDGFGTLLMHNRLDLTVEAIASRPECRRFFTEQQLATAAARLGTAAPDQACEPPRPRPPQKAQAGPSAPPAHPSLCPTLSPTQSNASALAPAPGLFSVRS